MKERPKGSSRAMKTSRRSLLLDEAGNTGGRTPLALADDPIDERRIVGRRGSHRRSDSLCRGRKRLECKLRQKHDRR